MQTKVIYREEVDALGWQEIVGSSQLKRAVWLDEGESTLLGVRADEDSHQDAHLIVEFQGGGIYAYEGAPQEALQGLVAAESAGRFLNLSVKNVYPFTKLAIERE